MGMIDMIYMMGCLASTCYQSRPGEARLFKTRLPYEPPTLPKIMHFMPSCIRHDHPCMICMLCMIPGSVKGVFGWYPHPELNGDGQFRKLLLYPFELWGRSETIR